MDGDGPAGGAASPEDGPAVAGAPGPRWSLARLAVTVLVAFAAAVVLTGVVGIALGGPAVLVSLSSRSPGQILLLTLATDGGLLLVLATVGRRLLHLRPRDLGLVRPGASALRYGVSFGIGLYALAIAVNLLQVRVSGAHPQDLVVAFGHETGLGSYLTDLLNGGAVAPFSEEIFFRGLIFGGLAQRVPVPAAAAVSALLFALLHGLGVVAPIFVLGLGLAYVYHRTGTIWASMATHSLVNTVSLTLLFVARP